MPIRGITFDFWRTLFCERREPLERRQIRIDALSAAADTSPKAAEQALLTAEAEFIHHHIQEQVTLCPIDAVHIAERELGVRLDARKKQELAEIFAGAILRYPPQPITDALAAVRLAAERYPIGIVSDSGISPGSSLRALLVSHDFAPHFRAMAFSDEVGVSKPQARMFETAAAGMAVAPSDLLHIGDLEATDIAGAKAIGAKAALFVGDNDRHRDNTVADYVFASWAEFIEILPKLQD